MNWITEFKTEILQVVAILIPFISVMIPKVLGDSRTRRMISKIELGRGIPSISYNLRKGGSVLIDRKDARQSLSAVKDMGVYIEKYNRSAVIFPEGTRSRTGHPKPFAVNGLKILYRNAPSAFVVPVTINNSWKMTKWGSFPLGIGNKIELIIHDPISVKDNSCEDLLAATEKSVVDSIVVWVL